MQPSAAKAATLYGELVALIEENGSICVPWQFIDSDRQIKLTQESTRHGPMWLFAVVPDA